MDAEAQEKQKKHDNESAADLERVTDYAEEKEINVSDIGDMLAKFAQRSNEKQAEREKELSKVKISKEDVELVMKEMDISKIKAERALRENKGDAVAALTALVNA
uniref:Nascent polypeptide-associated complex subunit alpha-like UBA domain-containing protein n=1 Tax=Ciona savignyi TaxID=51511 RepID=H2ZMY5_CIOSA